MLPPRVSYKKRQTRVSVDLSHLKDYQYCHMDGVVIKSCPDTHKITVHLEQIKRTVCVSQDCVAPLRGHDASREWKAGQHVHVLCCIDGVESWWDALIVRKDKNTKDGWVIEWKGKYEDHCDRETVSRKRIRSAK